MVISGRERKGERGETETDRQREEREWRERGERETVY